MPVGKLYANGLTMGAGGNPNPVGGKRGRVEGWSTAAVRRHTRWLYSVGTDGLTGDGYAITLTLRDCPPTPEAWARLRKEWTDQVRRSGIIARTHWVVEWTRRKVPHLHGAVYFTQEVSDRDAWMLLAGTWLDLAAKYGAGPKGQHVMAIDGTVGWLEYLSKHAARGVGHYQRQGKPPGWDRTGRLWGYTGEWPLEEPAEVTLTRQEFYRFRRLVRAWRVADARSELLSAAPGLAGEVKRAQGRRRVVSARRMLRSADPDLSRVRGVSEWIPEALGMALLLVAAGEPEGAREAAGAAPRAPRPPRSQVSTPERF